MNRLTDAELEGIREYYGAFPLGTNSRMVAELIERRAADAKVREAMDKCLTHISNALEDTEAGKSAHALPAIREAMHYGRTALAALTTLQERR